MIYYGRELYHHGVRGQKWGVRNGPPYPLSDTNKSKAERKAYRRIRRTAKKDAKEYARAKMYYGKGAGNRRKLIKATVEERSKDSAYKEQFEKFLAEQDMAKHASKAKAERKANDIKETTAKNYTRITELTKRLVLLPKQKRKILPILLRLKLENMWLIGGTVG